MVRNSTLVKDLLLLALGAGLYTVASPPYEWAGAAWVALTPLFLVVRGKTPRGAFAAGLLYGVLFCAGIAYWVYLAIAAYFPFPFPFDLLFTLLSYGFFVGSYTGLAAALSCVLMRKGRPLSCRLGVPALWVVGEFARSSLFAGFSWELLGYTQYRHLTLIQVADLTGVYGVSYLLALSGYVAAELVGAAQAPGPDAPGRRAPWPAVGCLAAAVVAVLLYGAAQLHYPPATPQGEPPVTLALVQGQGAGVQRWQRIHYARTLFHYAALTRRGLGDARPDLVIWPEFAVGFYLDRELALRGQLGQFTRQLGAALLLGAPRVETVTTGERYYNSAYLLAPGGAVLGVYDKTRLLPFAEYRPLALPALVPHSAEHPSTFTAGGRATALPFAKGAVGALICYEATYPHLARRLVRDGARFLVNISNDTWLAGATAAAQHFSMAAFRAVENRRYLARVATAGVTGFVAPDGRPYRLSRTVGEVTIGEIIPLRAVTVYTRYGDWFVLACGGWALVALAAPRGGEGGGRP